MLKEKLKQFKQIDDPFDDWIINIHFILCEEFGWVSLEELKETPVATLVILIDKITKLHNRQREEMEKLKRKRR